MKEKINNLIPKAILAISTSGIADNNGNVKKEFKGYLSSIGSSVIQAGLLPTLAFFQNSSGKKADSFRVLDAVQELIKHPGENREKLISFVIKKCRLNQQHGNQYTANDLDPDKLSNIESEIMDALIALKLALRTFKIEEDE